MSKWNGPITCVKPPLLVSTVFNIYTFMGLLLQKGGRGFVVVHAAFFDRCLSPSMPWLLGGILCSHGKKKTTPGLWHQGTRLAGKTKGVKEVGKSSCWFSFKWSCPYRTRLQCIKWLWALLASSCLLIRYVGPAVILAAFITVPPQEEGDNHTVRKRELAPVKWLKSSSCTYIKQATVLHTCRQ